MTEHEVANLVREQLAKRDESRQLQIEVVEESVRRDGDWWYVPVHTGAGVPHTYKYYDTLARVEEQISEEDGKLHVLLVPAA